MQQGWCWVCFHDWCLSRGTAMATRIAWRLFHVAARPHFSEQNVGFTSLWAVAAGHCPFGGNADNADNATLAIDPKHCQLQWSHQVLFPTLAARIAALSWCEDCSAASDCTDFRCSLGSLWCNRGLAFEAAADGWVQAWLVPHRWSQSTSRIWSRPCFTLGKRMKRATESTSLPMFAPNLPRSFQP